MFTKCSDCLLRIIGLTSITKGLISEPNIADILVGGGGMVLLQDIRLSEVICSILNAWRWFSLELSP